jgi:hypothetical protein
MSRHFGEIHGIDVADAMIALARQRLRGIPHAHAHVGSGADLRPFADESFDFLYSYAVFQHIPAREVVLSYLDDAARVLKPGGLMRFQASNLAAERHDEATWHGCNITPADIREYAARHGLLLLALEGVATQYMWVTIRKPLPGSQPATAVRLRRLTNSESSEPVAPHRGRYSALSAWVEGLPERADLLSLELLAAGQPARLTYLGAREHDGIQQLNAVLPSGLATGLAPMELRYAGVPVAQGVFRIIPAPPLVPRLVEATDGRDYLAGTNLTSRTVKLFVEELEEPATLRAEVSGHPGEDYSILCTDPMSPRHEINFRLAAAVSAGPQTLRVTAGRRLLGVISVQVS